MKKVSHLFILAMVFGILAIGSVWAGDLYVGPLETYTTIQAAIYAAATGDTIHVAAGTYSENVVIDRQIILQGAGSEVTTIDGSGAGIGIKITAGGVSATQRLEIKDLRITNAAYGIRTAGNGLFKYFTFENLVIDYNTARGIELHNYFNIEDMQIINSQVINNENIGLRTSSGTSMNGLTISGSKFNGNTFGVYLAGPANDVSVLNSEFNDNSDRGWYGSDVSMTNFVVTGSDFSNNPAGAGLYLWDWHDNGNYRITGSTMKNNGKWGMLIFGNTLTNVLIEECTVQDNDRLGLGYSGIYFYTYGEVMTNVAVHFTSITGHNLGGGVENLNTVPTAIVDATANWWGDASGPYDPADTDGLNQLNLGGQGDAVTEYVLYDPWIGQGGFITGGGTIWSEAGYYRRDTDAVGQANFGFVSRYKKGANTPDGHTNFVFDAGGLHFQSSEYDWLVVTGNNAKFKGVGTIEDASGTYKFMIWADDDPDTFRIKIWEEVNGSEDIVYDNGSKQAITGGNIFIHKEKKK